MFLTQGWHEHFKISLLALFHLKEHFCMFFSLRKGYYLILCRRVVIISNKTQRDLVFQENNQQYCVMPISTIFNLLMSDRACFFFFFLFFNRLQLHLNVMKCPPNTFVSVILYGITAINVSVFTRFFLSLKVNKTETTQLVMLHRKRNPEKFPDTGDSFRKF